MRTLGSLILLLAPATAFASLITIGPAPDNANNIQAQNRTLTVQGPGNSTTESGCILFGDAESPCPAGITGGDTTSSQSSPKVVGDLNITSASDLIITFDAVETAGNGINLDALVLLIYDSGGSLIFSADLAAPIVLASTDNGNGNAEILIGLDAAQAAILDATPGFDSTSIIGLGANLSQVSAGDDSFYVSNRADAGLPPIPEPSTWSMLLLGVGAAAAFRHRRQA